MTDSIQQKVRLYLVHSFLYYRLNESIISDRHYDRICVEVRKLIQINSNPSLFPYYDLVKTNLSEDASGFSVRKYPAEIVSTAMHLLYQNSYIKSMTFNVFLARFGYSLT